MSKRARSEDPPRVPPPSSKTPDQPLVPSRETPSKRKGFTEGDESKEVAPLCARGTRKVAVRDRESTTLPLDVSTMGTALRQSEPFSFAFAAVTTGAMRTGTAVNAAEPNFSRRIGVPERRARRRSFGTRPVTHRLLGRSETKEQVLRAVGNIARQCGTTSAETMGSVPLTVTVGTAGSGKTAFCVAIRAGFVCEEDHWGPEIERKISESCPVHTRPEHVIFIMVTFGQCTSFDREREAGGVIRALIRRSYHDYVASGAQTLPQESLSDLGCFLSTIRAAEAEQRHIAKPDLVGVVLLVDELLNVEGDAVALLDELASRQQSELAAGRIFIPIVTSLSVAVFTELVTKHQRAVFCVPLPPLSEVKGLEAIEAELITKHVAVHPTARHVERHVKLAVARTGGHFRTLEGLFAADVDFSKPFEFQSTAGEALTEPTIALLLKLLVDPAARFPMTHVIDGTVTIGELAANHVIVFEDVNPLDGTVRPKIVPHHLTFNETKPFPATYVPEFKLLRAVAEHADACGDTSKRSEAVIPMAMEMKARALFHSGQLAPAERVLLTDDTVIHLHGSPAGLEVGEELRGARVGARPEYVDLTTDSSHTDQRGMKLAVSKFATQEAMMQFNVFYAELQDGSAAKPVTVAWDMKLQTAPPSASEIRRCVDRTRSAMTTMCGFRGRKEELYVMIVAASTGKVGKCDLPHGTIVVGGRGCMELLGPYGVMPRSAVPRTGSS